MGRFDGQVAIVTGGAVGIGGATARMLAGQGASVLIADIDIQAAQENASRIADSGGTALALHADVARSSDNEAMIDVAVDRWGRLDVLVQNAYSVGKTDVTHEGSALELTEAGWDSGMAVLARALFFGAKYAVPHMARDGKGSIINIASVHGYLQAEGRLVYEAGKAAVIGMTRQMACDFGPRGIRVNAICPGDIETEATAEMWTRHPGGREFFFDQYPLRRTGVPDDVAHAIAFLCSDEASFITGHSLVVDGGLTIQLQEDFGVRQAKYALEHPDISFPY